MESKQLLRSFIDVEFRPKDVAGDREEAVGTVDFNVRGGPAPARDGRARLQDALHAGPGGRDLRVGTESVDDGLSPGGQSAGFDISALVQVDADEWIASGKDKSDTGQHGSTSFEASHGRVEVCPGGPRGRLGQLASEWRYWQLRPTARVAAGWFGVFPADPLLSLPQGFRDSIDLRLNRFW